MIRTVLFRETLQKIVWKDQGKKRVIKKKLCKIIGLFMMVWSITTTELGLILLAMVLLIGKILISLKTANFNFNKISIFYSNILMMLPFILLFSKLSVFMAINKKLHNKTSKILLSKMWSVGSKINAKSLIKIKMVWKMINS